MKRDILLSIPLACILLIGCTDESKQEVKESTNQVIDKAAEVTKESVNKTTDIIAEATKQTSQIVDEVRKEATPIVNEVMESSKDIVSEVAKTATNMTQNVQKKMQEVSETKVDGKALYGRCGSCHGQSGEKKALNSSKVIQGWSKEQILTALKGYQDGSYGGAMKAVMSGQVKSFKEAELEALASYISSL
jgi:cytochrome c553